MTDEKTCIFQEGQVLLFDKPLYWTSFDLVNKVRIMIKHAFGLKDLKVGHAGTLDPLATGLMILCTGKSTKKINEFRDLDKEYYATLHFGETTPSFDLETATDQSYPVEHITPLIVQKTLEGFIGEQKQVPPLHSAKLIDGKRAYEYARKGKNLNLEPVNIIIREAELVSFGIPETKIRMVCSKGTYVRSFARDLGIALKSGCYLSALERSAIGSFKLKNAFSIEKFEKYLEQMKQI
ncbi:MAG TPA: tRNA pseudouridine(55) synthase TruB [Bacteroidales bacterium]|jgi:tRNA pseudouridine55 synthase|nr:tRNA pseudouridine(55) synthase TruB [Bacteroidales bacterium]HPM86805.1 tRNA pseudouridine(55) synthase TruB [Bacteroidales bacterium]